ncbi:MAG: anthranilate synthase component I family protein [Microbacterium sp.]|uniref:anthranilate synthase component I family protein n=1 Tax=Microbacterium sp. TaxID=51671 RepID=UPI003A89FEA9
MPSSPYTAVALEGWTEPAALFVGWIARHPHVFWLDAGSGATDGWSWLGIGEPADEQQVRAVMVGARTQQVDACGPFRGGWVGWAAYEAGAGALGAPTAPDADGPGSVWLRVQRIVAVDHAARRLWAIGVPGDTEWAEEVRRAQASVVPPVVADAPDVGVARVRHAPGEYADLIARCREAIRDGDAYQLCLTTRFSVSGEIDPVDAYLRLRRLTPSHHGGIIRSGAHALLSASPERFVECADGIVRTRPIKGTRPRSDDPAEDAALAQELQGHPKERAENVMIVDLMRNDLSRVSVPGSIRADRLLEVESYAAVHQLVSTVAGTLTAHATVGDVLDAAFPAGSMTGAPKLSAMTILHRLERGPRGVFAGCFGYVGANGRIDLAMVIRSIVVHDDGAYVGAGGGITWGSEPAAEVAEVGVKARAPLAALGAVLPEGW